jgi:hypothetical protein
VFASGHAHEPNAKDGWVALSLSSGSRDGSLCVHLQMISGDAFTREGATRQRSTTPEHAEHVPTAAWPTTGLPTGCTARSAGRP